MTRTNYIFIDFENVHETDWERIVGKPAKVTLILGEQHKSLPVAMVKKMLRCPGRVDLIETRRTGKDAADMVLALHIGEQSKEDPHGYFHIISGDKGFDATIEHLKGHGILAARRASLSAIPALMNAPERVQWLTVFLKEHPDVRPGSRTALEDRIQKVFGMALTPDEVAATIKGLVVAKVIELTDKGEVSFNGIRVDQHDSSAAPHSPPKPLKPQPTKPANPPKPNALAKTMAPGKAATPDARFEKLVAGLKNDPKSRPKTKLKLLAHIKTALGGQLTEAEQVQVLNRLVNRGLLIVDADGKTTYVVRSTPNEPRLRIAGVSSANPERLSL